MSKGRKGLKYGCPAHVLDAAEIFKGCWDRLDPLAVASCWARAKCLPFTETVNISAENRSYKNKVETETLENMCKLFQTLHVCQASTLDGLGLDEIFNANPKEQSSAEDRTAILQRWVNIEEDPEIVAAEEIRVFEEICAEFDNSITVSSTNENDQQSSSDVSIILEDENVQFESEPAFDRVKALTQIVD